MKGIEGPQVAENISKAKMREILKNVAPKLNNFGQIAKQGENLRTDAAIYPEYNSVIPSSLKPNKPVQDD